MGERRTCLETMKPCGNAMRSQTRIDLLFTMSEIPQAHPVKDDACEVMFSRTTFLRSGSARLRSSSYAGHASPKRLSAAAPRVALLGEDGLMGLTCSTNHRPRKHHFARVVLHRMRVRDF